MATILPFVSNKIDFDDEATRIMGEAFDAACLGLQDTGQPALVREIIAQRIIEAAKKGERDPARLRAAGLAALGYDREAAQGPPRRAAQRQSPGRSRVSQPRGRRDLGRGCQGQSRAAPPLGDLTIISVPAI